MNLSHTPAEILRQALIDLGVATDQEDERAWPIFYALLPEGVGVNLMTVHNTQGTLDGRLMDDGDYVEHPGFQIRLRTRYHRDGWLKAQAVWNALAGIRRQPVTLPDPETEADVDYVIQSVTLTAPVAPMGQDPDHERRENFSINGRMTLN